MSFRSLSLAIVWFSLIPLTAETMKWTWHQDFLREKFDTSHKRQIWLDEDWHLQCVFFDLDEDGRDELLAVTPSEEDRGGHCWRVWKEDGGGHLRQILWTGNINFYCESDSFVRLVFRSGRCKLLGIGMNAGLMDRESRHIVKNTPDCQFCLGPNNTYSLREVSPDVDTVFLGEEVLQIERLYPEWYFGFDFKPPRDSPDSPCLHYPPYRLPIEDTHVPEDGGRPEKFTLLAEEYRREARLRANQGGMINVYMVFLDADHDGRVDSYVTSDSDRIEQDIYVWKLYLQRDDGMVATRTTVRPLHNWTEAREIQPTVQASRNSFCQIKRLNGESSYLIVGRNRKNQVCNAFADIQVYKVVKLSCRVYPDAE